MKIEDIFDFFDCCPPESRKLIMNYYFACAFSDDEYKETKANSIRGLFDSDYFMAPDVENFFAENGDEYLCVQLSKNINLDVEAQTILVGRYFEEGVFWAIRRNLASKVLTSFAIQEQIANSCSPRTFEKHLSKHFKKNKNLSPVVRKKLEEFGKI